METIYGCLVVSLFSYLGSFAILSFSFPNYYIYNGIIVELELSSPPEPAFSSLWAVIGKG